MAKELTETYLQYAQTLSDVASFEVQLRNQKRLLDDLKKELSLDGDGSFGVEITAHAFKQIAERIESLAMENAKIYKDVFNMDDPSSSYVFPSNLKAFVITMLANARSKGQFSKKVSRNNSGGQEFHYTTIIESWSDEKNLEFTGIVENNNVKTGYFNWV